MWNRALACLLACLLLAAPASAQSLYGDRFIFNAGPRLVTGAASPEGTVTAAPGSVYVRSDGSVWHKATGTAATGWKQIAPAADLATVTTGGGIVAGSTVTAVGDVHSNSNVTAGGAVIATGAVAAGTYITEAGSNVPNATDHLGFFAPTSSAQLAGVLSDETGSGAVVLNNSPTGTGTWTITGPTPTLQFTTAPGVITGTHSLFLSPTGDLELDPGGNDTAPVRNYEERLGMINRKFLSLHAAELWVETLVAQDRIATIGGRVTVVPTTVLTNDLTAGGTVICVKHNHIQAGDTLWMEGDGKFEMLGATSGPIPSGANWCHDVGRNADGTGANEWYAGDAVVNTGIAGDGYIDAYSIRSATSLGYPGQVQSDRPVAWWRMRADSATSSNDEMNTPPIVAFESGTISGGVGSAANMVGTLGADPTFENTVGTGYLVTGDHASLDVTGSLTLEALLYVYSSTADAVIVSKTYGSEYHWALMGSDNRSQFCQGNGATTTCVQSAANYFLDSSTHHYAVTRDVNVTPNVIRFYRDGALFDTQTMTQAVAATTNGLMIGTHTGGSAIFAGFMDEVAIYNSALSESRLLSHANARLSNFINDTQHRQMGPTITGMIRQSSTFNDMAPRWSIGNLEGQYGYTRTTYGAAFGDPLLANVTMDATNGVRIRHGNTVKLHADTLGNLNLVGDLVMGQLGVMRSGASALDTGIGYWLTCNYSAGACNPQWRVGNPAGNQLRWDGTNLKLVSQYLTIDQSGVAITPSPGSTYDALRAYRFSDFTQGGLYAYRTPGTASYLGLLNEDTTNDITLLLQARQSTSGNVARFSLGASASPSTTSISALAGTFTGQFGNVAWSGSVTGTNLSMVRPVATDGEWIALRSEDVAHGITSSTATNTFGTLNKAFSSYGGLSIFGFTETGNGLRLYGVVSGDATGIGGNAAVMVLGLKKSGTGVTSQGADGNVFVVGNAGSSAEGGTTLMTIDTGGELYLSSVAFDGTGKVVCVKANNELGTCSTQPNASGVCTCG